MRLRSAAPLAILLLALSLSPVEAVPPEYTDSELLALELSGELLPPPEMEAQIAEDLGAVRVYDPFFEGIHVWPDWVPGELVVRLTDTAWQEYEAEEYHGLDSLNAVYGPVEIQPLHGLHMLILTFQQIYNPEVLGPIYAEAEGVDRVDPQAVGGDGNDIRCEAVGTYAFRLAWGDCPAGCEYQHVWVFQVEDGLVTLIDEYGDPLPPIPVREVSWGRLKADWR